MARKIRRYAWLLGVLAIACDSGAHDARNAEAGAVPRDVETADSATIVFLGTSLTAGYGLAADDAYPALISAKLDSSGLEYRVVNAGESGATSAGGLRRITWLLNQRVDVLVIELGANDGLRGQDIAAMRTNLKDIIDRTRAAYPDVSIVVAGMEAPPNLGAAYTGSFRETFPALAAESEAALIPFLLDGVAGVPDLNQIDGIHPTAEGQAIVADNVWRVLEPVLRARTPPR